MNALAIRVLSSQGQALIQDSGRPAARQAVEAECASVASECPLAGMHIVQGMERLGDGEATVPATSPHPVELLARAYGL